MKEKDGSALWQSIGKYALFAVFVAAPLVFLPFTQAPLENAKIALVGILLVVALVSFFACVIERHSFEYPHSLLALGVLIFTAAVGVSAIFSISPGLSLFGGLTQADSFVAVALYALAFFLSFYFFGEEDVPTVGSLFVLSMAVATLISILQVFNVFVFPWAFAKTSAWNTVGSVFSLGIMMASVVVLAAASSFLPLSSRQKKVLFAAAGLAAIGLFFLNFQLLWLLLAFVVIVIAGMRFVARGNFRMPLVIVVAAIFLAIVSPHLPQFSGASLEVRPDATLTSHVMMQTLTSRRFLVGSGPATFSEQFDRFRSQSINQTNFWNTPFSGGYDFLLTLATTTGFLGILAFLFLLVVFIRALFRTFESRNSAMVVSILLFFLAALFVYPGFFVLLLFLFAGLGIFSSLTAERREVSFESLKHGARFGVFVVAIVLAAASLAGAYVIGEHYAAAAEYAGGMTTMAAGNTTEAALQLGRAVQLASENDAYWQAASQAALAQAQQSFQNAGGKLDVQVQSAIAAAIQAAQRAVQLNPDSSSAWANLGNLYSGMIPIAQGADTIAVQAYQAAEKVDPWNPDLPVDIARMDIVSAAKSNAAGQSAAAQASLNDAEAQLTQSIALKPDYAVPRFLLAQLYIQEGQVDKAIERVQEIEAADPLDAGLAFQLGLLYYQDNQTEQAQSQFERAVALENDYSNARYFLGLIYAQKNLTAQAEAQFQAILTANPGNAEVQQILSNLAAGKPALAGISPQAGSNVPVPVTTSKKQ
jgi:tetratricopeptide (TPR) repeat protein